MGIEKYKLSMTSPEVDAALKRAASGGALDQQLQRKVNPNLLDNWYFGDPVDTNVTYLGLPGKPYYSDKELTQQVGIATQYNIILSTSNTWALADDGNYFALSDCIIGSKLNGIFVDRWKKESNEKVIEITNNGIVVEVDQTIIQLIPKARFSQYWGRTVTVSILYNNTLISATGILSETSDVVIQNTDVYFGTAQFPTAGQYQIGRILVKSGASAPISILAVKLELGDQQTLAHQDDNGNWVLNEIPNKAEQLAICSQYAPDTGELLGGWEHPPMQLGVEYRTTERYLGKPVYTKVVDCGYMANNKVITIVDEKYRLIDGYLKGNPNLFPMIPGSISLSGWEGGYALGGMTITLYAGSSLASSNHSVTFIAKYIDA